MLNLFKPKSMTATLLCGNVNFATTKGQDQRFLEEVIPPQQVRSERSQTAFVG
ncbi:hypothetical protein WAI453_002831 [Rhynchosporium graminicola]